MNIEEVDDCMYHSRDFVRNINTKMYYECLDQWFLSFLFMYHLAKNFPSSYFVPEK